MSRMTTEPARPANSEPVASASQPVSTGPIAWPIENITVKTATADPHAALGSDVWTIVVTVAGAVNIAAPNRNADSTIAAREVLTSGTAAPAAITTPTAASTCAGRHRARGNRQITGP